MANAVHGLVGRFASNRRGNVAIMFAMSVIPIIALVGAAVDYSNAIRLKQHLQVALDAAALAVARDGASLDDSELQGLADSFFQAHLPVNAIDQVGPLSVSRVDGVVKLSAAADSLTSFLPIMGIDRVTVATGSEVVSENQTFEVALVLDNSGSMSGSKLSSLKDAANALVDSLYGPGSSNPNLTFSLVPFSSAVNIGTQNKTAPWIDSEGVSSVSNLEFSENVNRFELYDRISNVAWPGCVEARPHPMDVNDEVPSGGKPDSLFVPYFAPDEPDNTAYWNSYLPDDMGGGNWSARQKNANKYKSGSYAMPPAIGLAYGRGPAFLCNSQPVLALTGSKTTVKNAIGSMSALGGTNITEGLMWGWRVISPGAPFTQGLPYTEISNRKIIILLTDGSNDWNTMNTHNKSYYSPYGYLTHGRLGITSGSRPQMIAKMNERLQEACANVNASNIRLYTITFGSLDSTTQDLMRDCATKPSLYFHAPSTSDIQATFETIAADIRNLRIVK